MQQRFNPLFSLALTPPHLISIQSLNFYANNIINNMALIISLNADQSLSHNMSYSPRWLPFMMAVVLF